MQGGVTSTIESPKKIYMRLKQEFINRKASEWLTSAMEIVRCGGMDTGELLNSIFVDITEDGFKGISAAKHSIYLEFGTEEHWVPFYSRSGEPILAPWAKRVLGLSREEMEEMGGIKVSTPELAFMRRSLAKL